MPSPDVVAESKDGPKKRGRPRGASNCTRQKTVKFSIDEGMKLMAATARTSHHPEWDWEGKSYPKTKRSHGPNHAALDDHGEVLFKLIWLAPNGYPDPFRLRDLLIQLHILF